MMVIYEMLGVQYKPLENIQLTKICEHSYTPEHTQAP